VYTLILYTKERGINMKSCQECDECVYIGEGDFICVKYDLPVIVLEEFSDPTEYYRWCDTE